MKESSRLSPERNPHRSSKSKTDLHKSLGGLWCERTKGWTFSLEEALVWFILTRNFFFYQLFGLSFWRHPFTAEHPLMNKWCNISPNLMKKNSYTHGWPEGEYILAHCHSWVNYSMKLSVQMTDDWLIVTVNFKRIHHKLSEHPKNDTLHLQKPENAPVVLWSFCFLAASALRILNLSRISNWIWTHWLQ